MATRCDNKGDVLKVSWPGEDVKNTSMVHTSHGSRFQYTEPIIVKHYIYGVSQNSDLQAGIWFGSVALSPIINLPHFTMVKSSLPNNVVFSAHVDMHNAAYISSIS